MDEKGKDLTSYCSFSLLLSLLIFQSFFWKYIRWKRSTFHRIFSNLEIYIHDSRSITLSFELGKMHTILRDKTNSFNWLMMLIARITICNSIFCTWISTAHFREHNLIKWGHYYIISNLWVILAFFILKGVSITMEIFYSRYFLTRLLFFTYQPLLEVKKWENARELETRNIEQNNRE